VALLASPAQAQSSATTAAAAAAADKSSEVEELVVTGIRSSLRSSQAIKQNSDVVVDSITSEDIGALPDRSVTEALQRIPGVSINRFAAGVDPDHFSVEGSGVVVRGLSYVRSELNGRDVFTANNGRGLGFQDVPSELMGGVDVYKSPSADMIEGGISGTVNLRTRVPFDSQHRVFAFSLEDSYGDFVKKWAPTVSALYTDRWDTSAGEFGLLLNYVSSDLKSRADGTQASNFGRRTDLGATPVYFPRGAAFRSQEFDRKRTGYAAAGQWRSNDRTMLATAQFMKSESTQAWTEHAMEIATDNVAGNGDSMPVAGTTFAFDSQNVFTNGTITGNTGWRDDQQEGRDNRTPSFGLQSNNIRRDVDSRNFVTDYGFNFKWTPNDRWDFNFDVQRTESHVKNLDIGVWASTYQNLALQLNGDDPPVYSFLPPGQPPNPTACPGPGPRAAGAPDCPRYFQPGHASFSDPFNSFWRSAMDHAEDSEGTETAFRADGEYRFADNGWLDSVKFGARYADRDQTTRFSTYNWGVLSEQWGGGGPVWLDDPVDGVPNANGVPGTSGTASFPAHAEVYPFDNFFRGDVPLPTGGQPRLFYNQNIVENYAAMQAFGLAVGDEWRARLNGACPQNWVPLAMRCNTVAGTYFLPQEINPVQETTKSAYGMLKFGWDLDNGMRLSGNLGLRYTKTDRNSQGFIAYPQGNFQSEADCAGVPADQTPPPFCRLPADVRQAARNWANGAVVPNNADSTFEDWLPSLNLKLQLNPQMLIRFAASKAISPPDIGLVRNYYNLALATQTDSGGGNPEAQGTVTVGNPTLGPIHSTNIDITYEWYFADVGSFTFSAFYKELRDVLVNNTARMPFTNNGATFEVVLTQPGNSPDTGKIKGFEVAYQQFYTFLPHPFDGIGVNANYTYVESKGVGQSTLTSTDPDVGAGRVANIDTSLLPLQGLSKHNFNAALIYEKGPISARLAWNWRSEFLLTTRDVIVPFAPIMNEATGQLDASFFYTINKNLKIGVQGVNLNNEITRTSQILDNTLLRTGRSWFMNDRRYTVALRGTF
jgi:TonB-dependent receptor